MVGGSVRRKLQSVLLGCVRQGHELGVSQIQDENGNLSYKNTITEKWGEHFTDPGKWIKANKQRFCSQLSQEATRTPRNKKAPGADDVPAELLRTGGDKTAKTI